MMKQTHFRSRMLAAGVAVLTTLPLSGAWADSSCEVPEVPGTLIDELVGWIALHTMYDVTNLAENTPEIIFCGTGTRIEYEGRNIAVEPELKAVYDLPNRRVFLVLPWSADDPYDRSVLLHEFVHSVQLDAHDWPCTGAPELEAYMLQAEYLKPYGVDPKFDWRAIFLLSLCPTDTD